MPALLPQPDPDGLLEYSVVYTDRALNHMSQRFQGVMKDISRIIKKVYNADAAAIVPGSGTFGMEAVARQFATDKKCLVIRNGWFSFRWTQIFDMGKIPAESIVLKARQQEGGGQAPFAPPPIDEVVAAIHQHRPDVVFAPHVETSSGIILPEDYLKTVGAAVRAVDGLFVVDCVASGTVWVDMVADHIDIVISAPQKGWSGSPCCALIALGERAHARIDGTSSSSFACDLKKWLQIMETYEKGAHATPPCRQTHLLPCAMSCSKPRLMALTRSGRSSGSLGDGYANSYWPAAIRASPPLDSRRPALSSATPLIPTSSRGKNFLPAVSRQLPAYL